MARPSWADSFSHPYHFRIRFERLPDGRQVVAKVQVVSYDLESAREMAIKEVRQLYKDDPVLLRARFEAEGYRMDR